MTAHQIAFYACISFLCLGAVLGLLAVWNKAFFRTRTGEKLIITDAILFVTSLAAAVITKWLG